ncbi:MAG: hypothetical protein PHN80_14730 [Hespellia sp.]|nr:hypothetical protein [Hespellia sp.]
MHQSEIQNPQEMISMEQYLMKRKRIRENEKKNGDDRQERERAAHMNVALEIAKLVFC